ncbi:ABC transporter permease [Echinicola sp. CAU 1574]|uniref:ABC transporter permease n=1 Tax=Echinicola arenosa TaxID=2774144 RepID=A0ABR9ARD5_9BACT|nr:ABC transporter permease [Echinicola arenosa]MBD8490926.1 ABC transporter permease [Echinicola arenosa]
MWKNYIKIAWRNLLNKKGFAFINIGGLAVGMASALLILLLVQHEWSMDRFHHKKDQIFRVMNRAEFNGEIHVWGSTPKPLGPALKEEYPAISAFSRFSTMDNLLFTVGEQKISSDGAFVDISFLDMFDFPLLEGDKQVVFKQPTDIVITQDFASRLFGSADALGKTVLVNNQETFTITGILEDLPSNTQFSFDYLVPWSYMEKLGWSDDYWGNNSVDTYVELNDQSDPQVVGEKIKDITKRHSNTEETEVILHAMPDWRLYSRFENGEIAGGRIEMIRLFGVIAGFILLIACINFMNLTTARSEKRAKEVGIRKVVGAGKMALVYQFLIESIIISALAGVIALGIVQLILPYFNQLIDKDLFINFTSVWFWTGLLGFVLLTGVLAGSYPAFFLSSFMPTKVLKGTFRKVNSKVNPRKILVVLQFTIAIILMISTLVIQKQIRHGKDRENGYDRKNLIYIPLTDDVKKHYGVIKQELINGGTAESMTRTLSPLTEIWSNTWGIDWEGKDPDDKTVFNRFNIDEDIVRTAGLTLLSGRDLDLDRFPSDSLAMLLNESAVKAMGFEEPLGQLVNDSDTDYHVVGVVKDFIMTNPFEPIEPLILAGIRSGNWTNVAHIKFNPSLSTANALANTKEVLAKYNPDFPFEYTFVDEAYAQKFESSQKSAKLAASFAFLTIFISCLGLFGLSAYIAETRTKEIGIRKVLGASVGSLTSLLSRDFVLLVVISCAIAFPVAWWAMSQFLKSYAYRINLDWWLFALAGIGAVLIAVLTVSSQAIKTALMNPVNSLRNE